MELKMKKNGQWEDIAFAIMPMPTVTYQVPSHSITYYYANDRQMVTVLTPEVTGTSCPYCGAPVRLVNGRGKCNYCESFI